MRHLSILFRHCWFEQHCLPHLFAIKSRPPGAMHPRQRWHNFLFCNIKYEFTKCHFISRWLFTCLQVNFEVFCVYVYSIYILWLIFIHSVVGLLFCVNMCTCHVYCVINLLTYLVAWTDAFFVHHQTPDQRAVAPFEATTIRLTWNAVKYSSTTTTTIWRPFVRDYPGESVPEG